MSRPAFRAGCGLLIGLIFLYFVVTVLVFRGYRTESMSMVPVPLPDHARFDYYDEDGRGSIAFPWVSQSWYYDITEADQADIVSYFTETLPMEGWDVHQSGSVEYGIVTEYVRGKSEIVEVLVFPRGFKTESTSVRIRIEYRRLYPLWALWAWIA